MIQSWTFLFDNLNNPFHSSLDNVQVMMTRDDFSQHGLEYYDVKCKRGREDDEAKKCIVHPELERTIMILRLTKNYLVLFGIMLLKRMQVERAVSTPMTPWRSIIQVSEDNLFLVVCSTEYALNMIVIFNLNRLR